MSWYVDSGSINRKEFSEEKSLPKLNRFWLKTGQSKEVLFIDDAQFGVFEHKLKIAGRWEAYTCSGIGCAFCGRRVQKFYTEYYSIFDLTPWTMKDGKEVKFSRRALAAGKSISELLAKRREDLGGSLFGKKFKVSRLGEKSPSCGNDWSYAPTQRALDLSKLPEYCQPLNFKEVLKPMSKQEMMAILDPTPFESFTETAPLAVEEDIPF